MSQSGAASVFHIWDHSAVPMEGDVLLPFGYEEWLCQEIGKGTLPPGVHLWRHRRAAVLGLRDRRLPHAEAAMQELAGDGWSVAVRNSGGAFVPLDEGVVNLALMLPNPEGKFSHHADFHRMVELLELTLAAWGLQAEAGEVQGAYCPGEYDVAVRGRKFCGIAQRRQVRASSVQAFVVASGSGAYLAGLAKNFYETASGGLAGLEYPEVELSSTASLAEQASEATLTAEGFVAELKRIFIHIGGIETPPPVPPAGEIERLAAAIRERYDRG
ncbi:octanoyl-[GcvH]:protein N-octanoyltransferase [Paenibacillus phyllosphaerae]|uniref:Octanoyl-[GcvH]:protein N-octanoyltransferase n=1 Tax=Paenibacillus phyllosphaerae TaxID=274593 RepID=A0A7W5B1G1_9BACL|nr:hypothetical protein [Paenibacillus phyllosphaerae]MBB3112502.1 octanoyl-[GcvH]:protein N-octanoyltransferase [Paenibacillus phyllosphaerae]